MKEKVSSIMIAFALLATSSFPAYANGNIPNMTSQQQSVDVKVEIVDSPSTEDQDWPIIGTEQYQQTNQFTGKVEIISIIVRQGPPKVGKGACRGDLNNADKVISVAATCVLNAVSVTRSSSEPAGGVTGFAKNYADRYCGGSDCTYYKLKKLEIWWTRSSSGWIVRSARTSWGCSGSCAVCPNNTSYSYLFRSGYFTPSWSGNGTSTYRYTSTGWPIMKSTDFGTVVGGNDSTVESPTHTTQPLSVYANFE